MLTTYEYVHTDQIVKIRNPYTEERFLKNVYHSIKTRNQICFNHSTGIFSITKREIIKRAMIYG